MALVVFYFNNILIISFLPNAVHLPKGTNILNIILVRSQEVADLYFFGEGGFFVLLPILVFFLLLFLFLSRLLLFLFLFLFLLYFVCLVFPEMFNKLGLICAYLIQNSLALLLERIVGEQVVRKGDEEFAQVF